MSMSGQGDSNISMCFLKALAKFYAREGGTTAIEYHQQLLAHLAGVRHPEDNIPSISGTLRMLEPWAGCLREVALNTEYEPLQGRI
jgi:hypothetical protein